MGMYVKRYRVRELITSDAPAVAVEKVDAAHLQWSAAQAVAASADGVHAALNGSAHAATTTGITNPAAPRNITATAGGTAGDIKAIQVIITGTNYADEVITETLPAFTVDTAGIVEGSKAFKTITNINVPAHDGTGATTTIGWGDKLGLPYKLSRNTVLKTYLGDALEGTAATVAVSSTAIESNTIDLNSALNGTAVDAYLIV